MAGAYSWAGLEYISRRLNLEKFAVAPKQYLLAGAKSVALLMDLMNPNI